MGKLYKILTEFGFVESEVKGEFAGYKKGKIFGRLDCKSGMKMKKENRVFFFDLKGAVKAGYRPCKKCKPIDENDFEYIHEIVKHKYGIETIEEFYNLW